MAERDGSGLLGVLVGAMIVILIGVGFLVANDKFDDDENSLVIKLPGAD